MDNQELLRLYRQMLVIRRFEDRSAVAYRQDKVGGYLHVYIGQEAVACGLISVLKPGDVVIDSYRDHGHFIACGGGIREGMAELYGKDTGCSRGKGGSMHLFSKEHGFYGGSGIVGAGIGMGAGLGFAIKYRKQDNVCLCFFGDGAAQTGLFHETMNMASLWNLPVVFIIENNLYAMGTSVERASSETELYKRAAGYKMEGERVDGMDLFAVREVAERVIPQVRETQRPVLLEAITYRYRGHGAADPGTYRTKEEVDEWRKRDPIGVVEAKLIERGAITEADVEKIHAEVQAEVEDCLKFADESPWPAPESLYEHVYA
ncbi:MAG: pyruvate dehydrogenase (acetyl-transferring) E1 component subunit alpha [Armatimonadota bacterium]